MSIEADIRRMHDALGFASPKEPGWPPAATAALNIACLREEVEEAIEALEGGHPLDHVAKELCDVVTVAISIAVNMGIPFDACWSRVLASNLAKAGGPRRADGKQMKPPGWQQPDLSDLVRAA